MSYQERTEASLEANEREAAVDAVAQLELLTRSVAWGMVVAFIEDQTTRLVNSVMLEPALTMEQSIEKEFQRGQYNAYVSLRRFVEEKLRVSKETVELYREAARLEGE